MLQAFIFSLLIVAIGIVLLCVRLFFGKGFVHTHIDGNRALNRKGIHCVQAQDAEARRQRRTAVKERRDKDAAAGEIPT